MKITADIVLNEVNYKKLLSISKFYNMSENEFIINLLKKELENVVYFENGFKYDKQKRAMLNSNDEYIEFTNLEYNLLNFLLKNENKITPTENLLANLGRNETMSIYSLRNKIKTIREKTYPEIITSKSRVGYKINVIFL